MLLNILASQIDSGTSSLTGIRGKRVRKTVCVCVCVCVWVCVSVNVDVDV